MNQNQNVPQENSLLNKEILLKNPYKKLGLSLGKKKTGGRNNQGRITAYHRGGGNKLRYIYINKKTGILHSVLQHSTSVFSEDKNFGVSQDLFKNVPLAKTTNLIEKNNYQQVVFGSLSVPNYNTGEVKYLVKDPNRTSWIAGVYWSYLNKEKIKENTSSCSVDSNEIKCLLQDNPWYSYYSNILAPEGLTVGSYVSGYKQNKHKRNNEIEVKEQGLVATVGQKSYLKDLMVGTLIHNIDGKYIRAAGCSGIIISKLPVKDSDNYRVTVKLQSGQYKVFSGDTLASVGILSNGDHKTRDFRKAGQKRWLGRRPIVRGVAMNPIDHPHGGGEGKSSGGRPSVTPWGKPTKGKPTRSPKKPKLLS